MSQPGWNLFSKLAFLGVAMALPCLSHAQALAKPGGPVILTVSGNIAYKNSVNAAEFDAAMLDALGVSQISTSTPWHKGVVTFAGPALKSVLVRVGAKGQTLKMTALDQYEVRVPIHDAEQFNPILARRIGGRELRIKDQGPLFMVYPFDQLPALKNDIYFGRSIWHLTGVVVE